MAATGTAQLSYDTTAYNKLLWFALRPELYFDACADVRTTPQTHKGASVQFNIVGDLAAATTALTETSDITTVAMSDSVKPFTLNEYGNGVETTAKLHHTSFIELDPAVANVIGYNAGLSMDTLARNALAAATNVRRAGGGSTDASIEAAHVMDSTLARHAYADLQTRNVRRFGGFYRAFIHPDQAFDLKEETGETGWREVHNNSLPEAIQTGSIGAYEGFHWIVTPRAPVTADIGKDDKVDVYDALFLGQEALAKGYTTGLHTDGQQMGASPIVVPGPITDKLKRFVPMGWYWFGVYGIFRQEAITRIRTASSRGANS